MNKKIKVDGFTLVEIMVSMVISSLVIAGIYGVYTIQQRSYTVTEQVAEMQQKIRSAVDFISREVRMTSYDPRAPYDATGTCDNTMIMQADTQTFSFQYCDVSSTGNGQAKTYTSQRILSTYSIYDAYSTGIIDDLGVRHNNGTIMPLAEGVDAIEFRYFDVNGVMITTPVVAADRRRIRTVQLSLLVRASYPDRNYTDRLLYIPASGRTDWDINGSNAPGTGNPANDNFHRRLLITSIQLRNNI